ncbi:hypothetical protein GRI32_06230 [Altererythrobacter aestuarii]|uniref:Uncharacterized protein n=1 Tax=Alteraurantiacibacter aestuarii TaxID=650004 RepID=A0A844ZLZ0_9SPHN|nr:hypothetical protein [Alteraurantiacibacter aestuarii]
MSLLKAIPIGIFFTLLIALFMGSGGTTGGQLNIRSFDVDIAMLGLDFKLYWSWMLFLGGTFLFWVLIFMMGD